MNIAPVTQFLVPGPAVDEPIAMVPASGTAEVFYTDHHGSIVATSDTSGNLIEGPFTYDPHGNCYAGASACSQSSTAEPFKYTGQYFDAETGLLYYRARMYGPDALHGGRFLQTDPVGYKDDLNLYTYVGNDPTNRTDPSGMDDPALYVDPSLRMPTPNLTPAQAQIALSVQVGVFAPTTFAVGAAVDVGAQATANKISGRPIGDISAHEAAISGAATVVAAPVGAAAKAATLAKLGADALTKVGKEAAGFVERFVSGAVSGGMQASAQGQDIAQGAAEGGMYAAFGGQLAQKVAPNANSKIGAAIGSATEATLSGKSAAGQRSCNTSSSGNMQCTGH